MTSFTEQPGHRTIRSIGPDPSDHERELKRQAALKCRPELVARIEQGLRARAPMRPVKRVKA